MVWGVRPWGARRILAHVKGLPRDSATIRALRGEMADWTWDTELLAAVFDGINALCYYTLRAAGVEDARPPKPFPRPGREEQVPVKKLTDFNAFLSRGTT